MSNKNLKIFIIIFCSFFLSLASCYRAEAKTYVGFPSNRSFNQTGSGTDDFYTAFATAASYLTNKTVTGAYVKTKASSCGKQPSLTCLISATGARKVKYKTLKVTSSNAASISSGVFNWLKAKRGVFLAYNSKRSYVIFRAGYDLKTGGTCNIIKGGFRYCATYNGKILSSMSGLKRAAIAAQIGKTYSDGINLVRKTSSSNIKNNVVVALGQNNCSSKYPDRCDEGPVTKFQVSSLISAIRAKNPLSKIYLMTNYASLDSPSSDSDYSKLKSYNNDKYKEAVKNNQNVYLIDWANIVSKSSQNKKSYVYPDGHPTPSGSTAIGQLILKTIKSHDTVSNGSNITIIGDSMISLSNKSGTIKGQTSSFTYTDQEFCITGPGLGAGFAKCGSAQSFMKAINGYNISALYY